MKRAPICIVIVLLSLSPALASARQASAQTSQPAADAQRLYGEAVAAYSAKDYARSIELALKSIEAGARRGSVPYHLACCYALTGKPDDAFKYLNLAIERGWRDADHTKADADLESLHADPRWEAALKACEAARDEEFRRLKEPQLARELLRRMALDQRLRNEIEKLMRGVPPGQHGPRLDSLPPELNMNIDADNTAFMQEVVDKHGWPGKSLVGEEAANAAWLLVQHADQKPEFQNRCLPLLQAAFETGDVTGQQLAYLTDRVRVAQGKPQVYGTQFVGFGDDAKPAPIEDEANVDQRRKKVGLQPLAEYAKQIRAIGK